MSHTQNPANGTATGSLETPGPRGVRYWPIILALTMATGCASGPAPRSGFQMYADAKNCQAQDRPYKECSRMMDAAFGQIALDAEGGYAIDHPTTFVILH